MAPCVPRVRPATARPSTVPQYPASNPVDDMINRIINGRICPSNPDNLRYVVERFGAAADYFQDSLAHVVAHVRPVESAVGEHRLCVSNNLDILRHHLCVQGFTHPSLSLESVLRRYELANQSHRQVADKLRASPMDLKLAELEDCIFRLRTAVADLIAGISRLFPNFCPILERARVTPDENHRATTFIRRRLKDMTDEEFAQAGKQT